MREHGHGHPPVAFVRLRCLAAAGDRLGEPALISVATRNRDDQLYNVMG